MYKRGYFGIKGLLAVFISAALSVNSMFAVLAEDGCMSGDQAAEDYMADGYASDEYFSDECIADEFLTGNNAAQHPFGENVSYTLSGKTLTLSGSGYVSRYCLPEELPFNVNDVEKLVINDGIEQLDSSLFEGYENLREVKIAGSVKVIGNSAFACWAGDSALEKVELEEGVEELGSSSFRGNKALKSIILPESLKVLGGGCFESTGLKSIEIPAGVEEIDLGVSGTPFNSCVDLTELTVSAENKKYDSRDGCNAVIETATDTLVAACRTTEIPESVTALGPMSYCNLFFEIWQEEGEHVFTVPGHIKKIGERAFGANLLDRIVLEEGIEEIDDLAFWNNNITKLEIPASVRYIGGGIIDIDEDEYEGVFVDENNQVYESPDNRYIMEKADSKLVLSLDFHIPEGTKILGKYLFHQGCPKEIEIPVGVTTLEDEAIRGVVNSGIVIKIPNTVTKIGMRNFFPSDNYSIVGDIYYGGSEAEWNLIKMESGNYPKQFNIHFEKQTFTDGSGLEFILSSGTLTVQGKGALTRLPSNLVSIMGSQIKHIVIGEEITNVGSEVFRHCDDLDSVTFLGKDTKINSTAFKDTFLKDVYYPGDIYEWNALEVDRSDDSLKYAVIHFEEGEVRQLQVKDYSGEFKYVMTSGFEDGSGEGKYDYSLDFSDFSSSSTEFNQSLVKMSIRMAMAAMAKGDGTDHTYITDLFNSLRLKDARYSYTTPYKNSIGYAIGRKTLYGYRDDSELVVVAIRGGGYGNEWVGNVNVGNAGDHAGFDIAAQTVEKGLKDYLEEYIDKEGIDRTKVKIWISGYSRGAAVSNLLAAKLDRGEIEDLQKENIFAYCFECPRGTVAFKDVAWSNIYDNIFNFINPTDLVPNVAMNTGNWSFRRYGRDYYLPSAYSTWYTSFSLEKGLNVQKSMSHELILMRNQLSRIVYEKNNYSSMLDKYSNVGEIMRVWGLPTENDQPEINLRMMQRVTNLVTDRDMYYTHIQPLAEDLLINGLGNDILLNPQNVFNAFAILWVNAMKKQPDVFTRTMVLADRLALAYDLKNYKDDAIVAHYPEVNLAWIDSLYNESGYASRDDKYNRLYFNCPVDVEILDASGETVCLIKNDEVLGEGGVIARIDEDGQKVVILPADQEYMVKAVGNGEGTMTILNTICRMGEAIPDESEIYTELKVEKDMAYQATVSKNEILLENSDGQILEPDVTSKGDEVKYYQVELKSTHEDALYSGGGAYLAGEYARFEAGSDEVYSFLGWDIDGVRVSTDNVYRIPVTEDVTVTAVFEKIASDPDKEGQPEKEKLPPITKAKGETIILGDSVEVKLSGVSPADITAKGNAGIYNDGFVTGVKKGKVKLYTTVMKKGKEKRVCICTIKVEDPKLKAEIKMKSQKKKKLKLSGTKKSAVWKCDDETVVKVDASTGELLAISPGGAMVTAVIPGYPFDHTYSCYVSVK